MEVKNNSANRSEVVFVFIPLTSSSLKPTWINTVSSRSQCHEITFPFSFPAHVPVSPGFTCQMSQSLTAAPHVGTRLNRHWRALRSVSAAEALLKKSSAFPACKDTGAVVQAGYLTCPWYFQPLLSSLSLLLLSSGFFCFSLLAHNFAQSSQMLFPGFSVFPSWGYQK